MTVEASYIVDHFGDFVATTEFGSDYEHAHDRPPELPNMIYPALCFALRGDEITQLIVLSINGRNLSAPTKASETTTPYSTPLHL